MSAVAMTVNGKAVTGDVDPRTLLVQFLRENLRLTGTHVGCDTSQCGACVVHVDGKAVKSCTVFAWQLEGANVTTIEGLAEPNGAAAPDAGGVPRESRPAMRLLHARHDHDRGRYGAPQGQRSRRQTIRHELEGNICRCTGYHNIVKAIAAGAKAMARRRRATGSRRNASAADPREEETAMSATGIGAAVRRKEDQRFITGKGHYTDDVNRPGQAHAYFLRSPHAHAKIKSIDGKAAAAMPGVRRGAHRRRACRRQDRQSHLRLDDHSKDGSPMKMAPHPAIAHGKANHVGDAVAVVIAETLAQAKDAAEKIKVDYEVLPAVADPAKAQSDGRAADPRRRAGQHHLPVAPRRPAKAADAAFKSAKHVTKLDIVNNRLVPNAIEPRAAIGEYDAGTDSFTLWNTTQNPHVARLVSPPSSAWRRSTNCG